MERKEFALLISRSAAAGAQKALDVCENQPDTVTKSQAYRLYGRSNIDRWINEKLIVPNTKNHLDKAALARIAAQSNRITYLPVAER